MTPVEQLARAFYAYDNPGADFDTAPADVLAPYFDLAELARRELVATSERDAICQDCLTNLRLQKNLLTRRDLAEGLPRPSTPSKPVA